MSRNDLVKRTVRLPGKRTINLAGAGKKKLDLRIAIPAIILIVAIAVLVSKFAVIDRFNELTAAENEVSAIRRQLDDGYKKIDSYGDLVELYAHYTYSDMTQEELARADRVVAMDMLSRLVMPELEIKSWDIKDNVMTVNVLGESLQQVNLISQRLMEESNVDYCTVSTAVTEFKTDDDFSDWVNVQLTVYLLSTSEEVSG